MHISIPVRFRQTRIGLFSQVLFFTLWFGLSVCIAAATEDELEFSTELIELSIEDLIKVKVTSVSKKPQKILEAAAAIFVITQEDIRRSGAVSIPEVLRMVPGLEVAKIDSNKWAVTSRGFNCRFANKLLVLIDGRTVYTPLFSGVYWDMNDTLLNDIDRIEIIRGPGAALWGANAVNGVINIITKEARDTQGTMVVAGTGTEEQGFGAVRYGGMIDQDTHYRVYAKYFNRDSAVHASGEDAADKWDVLRTGFRIEYARSDKDRLTLQGDVYNGQTGETVTTKSFDPTDPATFDQENDVAGANLLGRWKHSISDTSNIALQVYYDYTDRSSAILEQRHDTFDIDFQHHFGLDQDHQIVWGLGYRFIRDDISNTFYGSWNPDNRDIDLLSAFIQDEITLVDNKVKLTLGSKFEHNDYTGFEIQPNARLIWTPDEYCSIWTAVSRAVRTPSRTEADVRLNNSILPPGSLPGFSGYGLVTIFGSDDYESEELLAYELGYRLQPNSQLSLDIAAFFNDYSNLRTIESDDPFVESSPEPTHITLPCTTDNKMKAEVYGFEVAIDWLALDWWRLQIAYTYLQMQLHLDEDSKDTTSEAAEGESPHNQISVRSSMSLPMDLELNLWTRFVDRLPSQDIDSYVTLDVRLGWMPHKQLEVSIVGQNLFDNNRREFEPDFIDTSPTEVERNVYGSIIWRF